MPDSRISVVVIHNRSMAVSKRAVLRSGFGIIIALLVISTVMAYRVQETFSMRSAEIHQRLVTEQQLFTSLRRVLYMGGIAIRDHLLDPNPDRDALKVRLVELKQMGEKCISELHARETAGDLVHKLADRHTDFWAAIDTAVSSDWSSTEQYAFLRSEIIPRREQAGVLMNDIEKTTQSWMADREREFRANRAASTQQLVILLTLCLIVGVAVAHVATRYAEHLEREAAARYTEMSKAKQQLERLSLRLMEVQEEERTRLSRELHDDVVQDLAVLKMEIAQAQAAAPAAKEPLARARRLAETTVQALRNISLLLRPSLLDDLGLGPALQWQAEEVRRRTGMQCIFEEVNLHDDLPEAIKTAVYRVTQEALRNCEKHSGAKTVRVRVVQLADRLEVTVRDDGRGFPHDFARSPSQLGLLGMRERATALGGTLRIENAPGGGAQVSLSLPLMAREGRPAILETHV